MTQPTAAAPPEPARAFDQESPTDANGEELEVGDTVTATGGLTERYFGVTGKVVSVGAGNLVKVEIVETIGSASQLWRKVPQ